MGLFPPLMVHVILFFPNPYPIHWRLFLLRKMMRIDAFLMLDIPPTMIHNTLTLIEKKEDNMTFKAGDRVKYQSEHYTNTGTITNVSQLQGMEMDRITMKGDDGSLTQAPEKYFTHIKADKESRFEEGQEVVVSDQEMRFYGEHGIVERVQEMDEFGSSPVLLVKLLDSVEYLIYSEDFFQSLGDFYENKEKEDMIGLGDTVVLDVYGHQHAGKRGIVTNVGFFDKDGVEHIQVSLLYDGQNIIEPIKEFVLITEEDLAHEDQMLMSLQDPDEDSDERNLNPGEDIQKQMEEYHTGELYNDLVESIKGLVEQEQEEETETNLVQIVFRDGTEATATVETDGDVRDQLTENLLDLDCTIAIGDIVTHANNIKYVQILDEK